MIHHRSALPLALTVLLVACGSSSVSNDGQTLTATSAAGSVAVAVGGGSVECKELPPHVALPADAKVRLCTHGQTRPGHVGGSVSYTTAMAPDAVIAFYKDKARGAGLKDGLDTGTMYSATDGTRRTMMAMPKAEGGGSHVTLNWGADQ